MPRSLPARPVLLALLLLAVAAPALLGAAEPAKPASTPAWHMNATIIEACSCPMFCQCYFNSEPSAHAGHEGHEGHAAEHFCRFNNALRVNSGSYGSVKLDGAKFWVSGDLGGDFSQGQMDWGIVTFDKALTKEQRDAIGVILGYLYPVKWNSLTTGEGDISWTPGRDEAHALLDGGKTAEVALKAFPGMRKDEPVVMKNLPYWGAPRNDGFVMMPNTVEAWRTGTKPFEFKGTNGFMITLDIDSQSVAPKSSGS
jgi:hypothetical protein